jgi:hypothetical protein
MQKRNVLAVVLLPLVTFGIYMIYWFVKTKGELVQKGGDIPTSWLLIIPFANIWWIWKYYEASEQITNKGTNAVLNLLLGFFITPIPMALCQSEYNKMSDGAAPATTPNPAPQPAAAPAQPEPNKVDATSTPPAPIEEQPAPAPENPPEQKPPQQPPLVQ